MKFNIYDPTTGGQKKIEIDDEKHIRPIYERRMGHELDGEVLGDEFKGYIFKLAGGNDKDGFPMKQGIMINGRTRMMFRNGRASTYKPRRTGEIKRRSVRGCIYGSDLAVIFLKIVKKGEKEIDKVTNVEHPNRLAPKRASNIRKMYALVKGKDDVRKYVNRRTIKRGDKTFWKAPRIQRLVTETRLRRKQILKREKKDRYKASKANVEKYEKLLSLYVKEKKAAKVAAAKATAAVAANPAPAKPATNPAKPAPTAKPVAPKKTN